MTGAAGGGPDTAGTDPLIAVVADALADKFLCRTIPIHRDKPEHLCRTCKEDKARMAAAVVAAVRAHQNTIGQHATAITADRVPQEWLDVMYRTVGAGDGNQLTDDDMARGIAAIYPLIRAHQNTTDRHTAAKAPPTDKSWIEMEGG